MLTPEERLFAANADIIVTKNKIIKAVYELFGRLAENYGSICNNLPESLLVQHAKISKGENYLGLPWVMLDYPRNFGNPDIFAIRTLFWWGNYFSIQILLQGSYARSLTPGVMQQAFNGQEWFFCTGANPWQHHFKDDYMKPVDGLTPEAMESQYYTNGFYKIGTKLSLSEWEQAETILTEKFALLIQGWLTSGS